jgi:putative endonuclease
MTEGFWVYILASKRNGTLYTGVTEDLSRRVWQHRTGTAEGFTKRYGVRLLVHAEQYPSLADARAREKQIKGWRRKWKLELIEASNPGWDDVFDQLNQ